MEELKNVIHAILVKPGQEPEIVEIPAGTDQPDAICDLVDGNFGATEFFDVGNGASLFIVTNDLSVPLGLAPNRHFPEPDQAEIIFGNCLFIAVYNEKSGKEGIVDMPEQVCHMFIEQIKSSFEPCQGDEKPSSKGEIYIENEGTPEERAYKWVEIEKPANVDRFLQAGRAKLIQNEEYEVIEIHGRYFRQVTIATEKEPLQ